MTTINDQPQHLLARYADRTGCKRILTWSKAAPAPKRYPPISAAEEVSNGATIEIVLSEYNLPSHLPPYKDNPRLPGDGYRVPTGEDRCGQPHELWNDEEWMDARQVDVDFSNLSGDYRLPASVLPPDWDEMTREDAPTVATADTSPHHEIFEAHGLEWYRHDGSDECPCDPEMRVEFLFRYELEREKFESLETVAKDVEWKNDEEEGSDVIGWRPADAPAKLPRPDEADSETSVLIRLRDKARESHGIAMLKLAEATKRVAELERDRDIHRTTANLRGELIKGYEEKLAAASTPTLRPVAEMPEDVPEGCFVQLYRGQDTGGFPAPFNKRNGADYFIIIRLPAPPDPDAELRREFEAWMKGHYQIPKSTLTFIKENGVYALREHETAFQAFKAGRAKASV